MYRNTIFCRPAPDSEGDETIGHKGKNKKGHRYGYDRKYAKCEVIACTKRTCGRWKNKRGYDQPDYDTNHGGYYPEDDSTAQVVWFSWWCSITCISVDIGFRHVAPLNSLLLLSFQPYTRWWTSA